MNLSVPVLIVFILIIVIVIILYFNGYFSPYTPPSPPIDPITVYDIPSPWSEAKPAEGDLGNCLTYQFESAALIPAVPKFSELPNCLGSNCLVVNFPGNCTDDDQIKAEEYSHICQSNIYPGSNGGCRKSDGTFAKNGDIEKFFQNCGASKSVSNTVNVTGVSSICGGNIAEIALNFNVGTNLTFNDALCLLAPVAPNDPEGFVTTGQCTLSNSREIFRVIRGLLDSKGNMKVDATGNLAKIVDRRTGLCLAPNVTLKDDGKYDMVIPYVDGPMGPLKFIPCKAYNNGFWWALIPPLFSSEIPPGSGPAPQQIVYFSDVKKLPDLADPNKSWEYLTANGQAIYQSSTDEFVQLYPYTPDTPLFGNDSRTRANTQILDYPLYTLISSSNLRDFPFPV